MNSQPPDLVADKVHWGEVLIFFATATLVSAPFRLGIVALPTASSVPFGLEVFFRILRGIGPAVGYLVMRHIVRTRVPRTMTFFGVDATSSMVAPLVVVAGLGTVGVSSADHLNASHYAGILTGVMLVAYALGEEYGWRGYLQQALAPLPLGLRVFTIAVIWYLWHLNFLNPQITLLSHLVHFTGLLLGAWGLMKVSESTGSLFFVAAVHLSFNIAFDVNATAMSKLLVIFVCALVWAFLIRRISQRRLLMLQGQLP